MTGETVLQITQAEKYVEQALTDFHNLMKKQSSHYPFQICIRMRHICYHWELGTPDAAHILASKHSYINHLIQLPNRYMNA